MTREHDRAVPGESLVRDRVDQEHVEQEVMLDEDPEPFTELVDVSVRAGEEPDLRARAEVPIPVLVSCVVGEQLANGGGPRPVLSTVQPADHVEVEAAAVRERLGEPEPLTLR